MNGADVLVKTLEDFGVNVIFGVPGDIENYLFEALSKSSIEFVTVRHEQSAAFMADAHYRTTGKMGVCFSTLGPGATNMLTGIASSWQERSAVLAISGQLSRDKHFKDSHQYVDLKSLYSNCTKESFLVERVSDIQETFTKAVFSATSETTGPVHVSVPVDLLSKKAERQSNKFLKEKNYEFKNSALRCAKVINNAKNAAIIVGSSCSRSNAIDQINQFVDKTGFPVFATFLGKGVVSHKNNNFCGVLSRHSKKIKEILSSQDVIINIGFDVVEGITPDIWDGAKSVLHIDSSPPTGGGIYNPDLEVIGPIAETLPAIVDNLSRDSYTSDKSEYRVTYEEPYLDSFPYHPAAVPTVLSEKVENCIIIPDVGMHKQYVGFHYKSSRPNEVLFSNGFSSMGFSFPAAIGAKYSRPDFNVIAVTGDGGFQMNIQELATAVENGLGILIIVMNDNALGMVKLRQTEATDTVYGATYDHQTNYSEISKSYGGLGLRLESHHNLQEEILSALSECNEKSLPFVLDVPIKQYTDIKGIK